MIFEICGLEATQDTQDSIDEQFKKYCKDLDESKAFFDGIPHENFTKLMQMLDKYFDLKYKLRDLYNMKVSTNAALKMYEMISLIDLVSGPINSFCNAELPGAFISAINHYAKNNNRPLNWVASSYWPADEGATKSILEDKYGIYIKNQDRWLMGRRPDGTYVSGDVRDVDVITKLAQSAKTRLGCSPNLYTSDAGIDVSADYNRQEEATLSINFGQILCGIMALGVGGSLVTKQYTFFTKFNRALIYELYNLFDKLHIVKPLTSRPVNSEVYLVGIGFKGATDAKIEQLKNILKVLDKQSIDESASMLDTPPVDFDKHLLTITEIIFVDQQIAHLKYARKVYTEKIYVKKPDLWKKWIKDTKIKPINDSDILPSH
jgi:hypothetical protein